MGSLHEVKNLREKHRYSIQPWAKKISDYDDNDTDTEDDEKLVEAIFVTARNENSG
jgi:hypothetical protein